MDAPRRLLIAIRLALLIITVVALFYLRGTWGVPGWVCIAIGAFIALVVAINAAAAHARQHSPSSPDSRPLRSFKTR